MLDMYLLLAVPIFHAANAYGAAHAQNVVAIAVCQQTVIRIPITLRQLQLRRTFAIGVYGLLLVEIDTVCHLLALYRHTMVVQRMIDILFLVCRAPFRNGVAMPCLAFRMDDGIALARRISRCADTPERSGYPRGAPRE